MSSSRNIPDIPGSFDLATTAMEQQRFFTRVYGWMGGGLALTAFVASLVASSPALMQTLSGSRQWSIAFPRPWRPWHFFSTRR